MICGTRGSPLALAQTKMVLEMLGPDVEMKIIKTSGDLYRGQFGVDGATKGLFTKEIDMAMASGEIDMAVHSMKDVQMDCPFHMVIPKRGPCCDVMVTRHPSFFKIPENGKIGTGSPRRATELRHMRPDLEVVPIRGNVDTRIRKSEELDGVVVADAGLQRLGIWGQGGYNYIRFPPELFMPAACQGALAVVCRKDDQKTIMALEKVRDELSTYCALAELEVMRAIGGNCHIPAGAYASPMGGNTIRLFASINDPETNESFRDFAVGPITMGREMAHRLADTLMSKGAESVVRSFR